MLQYIEILPLYVPCTYHVLIMQTWHSQRVRFKIYIRAIYGMATKKQYGVTVIKSAQLFLREIKVRLKQ